MDNEGGPPQVQLIDGEGNFNDVGMDDFANKVKLNEWGISYSVISILGPQSSGKSTLLNHLFGTKFREMDANKNISQTTKGIWLARDVGVEHRTLVMDLEGTDGSERGEDDTKFEKQSCLFALAISDLVLVNMWRKDVGLCKAANMPLLRTVFEVMLRLPISQSRRKTLLFVLRDIGKSPLKTLKPPLLRDIQRIWESFPKPQAHEDAPITDFFTVAIEALSSFEERKSQFKEQVASLRLRISHSIATESLGGGEGGVVDASGFSSTARQVWNVIKENKDLDLPAIRDMVARVRCEDIAKNCFESFKENEKWCNLRVAAESGAVPGFGHKLTSIIATCLSQYCAKTRYFNERIRFDKRRDLEEKLLQHTKPIFKSIIRDLQFVTFRKFKEVFDQAVDGGQEFCIAASACTQNLMSEFDNGCADAKIQQANWDTYDERERLSCDIEAYIREVRGTKLSLLSDQFKALKCLFDMAAIRLDNEGSDIQRTLSPDLVGETPTVLDQLASTILNGVPSSKELISTLDCKSLWRRFLADTEAVVNQTIATQAIIAQGIAAQDAIEHNSSIVTAAAAAANPGFNRSFAAVAPPNSGMSNVIPRALRFVAECLKALARRFPNIVVSLVENLLPSGAPVIRAIRLVLIQVIKILYQMWPSQFHQLLTLLAPYEAEVWGANPEPQHAIYLTGNLI